MNIQTTATRASMKLISLTRTFFLFLAFIIPASNLFAEVHLTSTAHVRDSTHKIRIVTTTPTFADIAAKIGGKYVDASSLMKGRENVHNVPPKPSFVMKLRHADFFIHAGLDGEPWVPQLLKTTRKPRIQVGAPGNIDASIGITLKEVPDRGTLSRANGDVHVYGNPHYMTDPLNGLIVARHIRDVLSNYDPDHKDAYQANYEDFEKKIHEMLDRLEKKLAPYRNEPVVVYHKAWPYFLDRFHLVEVGEIEPKPDIPPGPQHLVDLGNLIREKHVRVVIVDTFNPLKVGRKVAEDNGAVAVVLAANVHGIKGADDYFSLFETDIDRLVKAFEQSKANESSAANGN